MNTALPSRTLTEGLFALVADKPVSDADLEVASHLVLDALANAIAGKLTRPGEILWETQLAMAGDNVRDRAFLIASLTHILETDDLHRESVVHPGCVVVPAVWAVAEREGANGRRLLEAVLAGFEACTRIGMAVGPAHYRIWHNTATCGPYGAAMGAAALLDLEPPAVVHALGNAGSQSSGLWQFLETGAMTKHLHAGRAADAGVLSAYLAQRGFTGPPAILEGEKGFFAAACPDGDPGAVLREPDAPWQVHATSLKPWPSCRHTHPAIDAALEIAARVDPGQIAKIGVETYAAAIDVCDRVDPYSEYEAKFSLQHCVAAALSARDVGFESFDEAARADLAPLRRVTDVARAEPFLSAYPKAWGARVTVLTREGRSISAERTHAKGDPEAPLSREEIITKARGLFKKGGVADADGLIAQILHLPTARLLPRLPL
ncbi:MAG: MmgE/PrpD family protein [Alphaproteobacteria bacterium]|nr:MmgE/PrpD family protein [Alphaproteobacteria bacterium]